MNRTKKILIVLIIISCLTSYIVPINKVHAEDKKEYVLYISSYSYSWETVSPQIKGVQKALSDNCVINYEFMDTKNVSYGDDYKQYYEILKFKLSQRPSYDGVIVADDAALKFVQIYKEELFPNIPIAFTGIDNIENAENAAKDPLISGITERVDYEKNIRIATKLLPKATKIIFINDRKENGIGIQSQLENSKKFMNNYEVSYLISSDYTKKELESKLRKISNDTIVFMVSLGQGKNNIIYTEDERIDIIEKNISVPVFRVSSTNFPNVFIGGYVVDHQKCAYLAGMMIKRTLEGKKMSSEQINEDTPSIYCFNQKIMDKYNISKSLLPEDTMIKNPNSTFLEKNYKTVINSFMFIIIMMLIIIIFVIHRNLKISKKANIKINDQNKELEMAIQAKEDFLSRMSHEMRTPLNSILGGVHLATSNWNSQKDITEDLFMVERAGAYLLNLINDILDVSRIEANKIQLNNEWCSPKDVIQSIEFMMIPIMKERNIKFECPKYESSAVEKVEWCVDSQRVQQIVINLLNNAAKFTPSGGTVNFEIKNVSFDDNYAIDRVIVSDTGCGMTKDFISHIGEAFSQEQNKYSGNTTGSGLGLYIVKNIVELMDGELEVQSEIGKGSTFSFNIKYEYRMKKNNGSEKQQEKEVIDLSGMKVLYADDNAMNQIILKRLLENKKAEVVLATNGQEAVDIISQSSPGEYQIILMDIRMPVMDGIEATQIIRNLNHLDVKEIPIIALSADAIASEIKEAKSQGLNDYLTKPIKPDKLYQTLIKYWVQKEK